MPAAQETHSQRQGRTAQGTDEGDDRLDDGLRRKEKSAGELWESGGFHPPDREDEKARRRDRGRRNLGLQKGRMKRRRRGRFASLLAVGLVCLLVGGALGWSLRGSFLREPVDPASVKTPDWVEQELLTVNPYSRPGTRLGAVNGIVIHYVGNPGTTAEQNRNYFEGLKDQTGENKVSVSSNFIIGLDGEIIECVPIGEMAYASNSRNSDTISIECCHPKADGAFTEETYASLVRLTAWLCSELDLKPKDVIRHYDVTGKECPKYFVDHPDAWEEFLKDVKKAMKNPGSPVDLA